MNNYLLKAPSVSAYEYNVVTKRGLPWQPGFFRRAPWLGIIAFLGALGGILAAGVVLFTSNNKPIHEWSVQPTVYLAIASAATNILLHFALSQAVTVAWWRRALRKDTTVADLHRSWDYGQSLWAALTSGRHFSAIALASILVALIPVNGPLLQRATRVQSGRFEHNTDVRVNIAPEIPEGYTGYLSNRAYQPALLTTRFVKVVQEFNQKSPISIVNSGCQGSCHTQIKGAGLVANCSKSDSLFVLGDSGEDQTDEEQQENVKKVISGTTIFGTSLSWLPGGPDGSRRNAVHAGMIDWTVKTPGTFSLGVQYKGTRDCAGTLVVRNCTFKPATVTYPVSIDGESRISLAAGTTISDDELVQVVDVPPLSIATTSSSFNASTYGGFFKALSDAYQSTVRMNYGSIRYQIFNEGALSNRYVDASDRLESLECSMSFRDPTDDIIADIRELMFRTAIASAESKDEQHVSAQDTFETPVYSSSYWFLAAAVLLSLLGWLAVIPVFVGWWHLGRAVSLSPIETAKAFGAPSLNTRDSNADASGILEDIGHRKVKYGVMTMARPEGPGNWVRERARLIMGEPERVRSPAVREMFVD